MNNCLACHTALSLSDSLYHQSCLANFWGADRAVLELDYNLTDIEYLAKVNVARHITVTGVQPKLSLDFDRVEIKNRLTIVGAIHGKYILKPPYAAYPQMPELEALCMLLAKTCGISTVPNLLIPLKSGELAYLTKRIDRNAKGDKFAMEDACQFTGRLTEHKYRGSYEQIAKGILAYSRNPLKDVVHFYEQVIVSFLMGNNDMHLKNFSLIAFTKNAYQLSPAYDMISAQLLMPDDKEDLALNLNGKKRKLKRKDFNLAMKEAGIPDRAIENLWKRIGKALGSWLELIDNSFLEPERKIEFIELIDLKKTHLEIEE